MWLKYVPMVCYDKWTSILIMAKGKPYSSNIYLVINDLKLFKELWGPKKQILLKYTCNKNPYIYWHASLYTDKRKVYIQLLGNIKWKSLIN